MRPSYKFGFRSSVKKNGLPGEGRHEGLVPRNDVLTNGFIGFSLARTLARKLFVTRLHPPPPPRNPEGVSNLKKAICFVQSDSIIGEWRAVCFKIIFVSCTISLSFSLNFPSFIWYHLLFLFNKSPLDFRHS